MAAARAGGRAAGTAGAGEGAAAEPESDTAAAEAAAAAVAGEGKKKKKKRGLGSNLRWEVVPRKDNARQGTPDVEAGLDCEARITEWRTESGINTQGK